ncbi:MAG: EAL domain-containing protein [Rhodocyclales bacterium]|nr:EAL domain-containing protein [Rhodocyclales bacterium]
MGLFALLSAGAGVWQLLDSRATPRTDALLALGFATLLLLTWRLARKPGPPQGPHTHIRQNDADAQSLRKFGELIEHSVSAMIITNADGVIEYVNARFSEITGYPREEVIGRKAGFWCSHLTAETFHAMWQRVRAGQVWEGELINQRKNGEEYWASVTLSPVLNGSRVITHFLGVQNDISERRRIEEQLSFLSHFDALTHLPNRTLLAQRHARACADALRDGTLIALVSLGIVHFKRINDGFGRNAGDLALKEIAQRLTRCARNGDTVSRHGGTEFSMLMPGLRPTDDIAERIDKLLATINQPILIEGEKLLLTVSAGAAVVTDRDEAFDSVLHKATVALHHAERQGQSHCVYTESLDLDAQERLSIENGLRAALERGGMELHYQPKVSLSTGRMVGVEALARWRHPVSDEYVPPQRFIPIAEECDLIQLLGSWALREACRQNQAWRDAGLPAVVVAVNLSAHQLGQPGLVEMVTRVLEDTGLDPALLQLELTESALVSDPDRALQTLGQLKALGLQLAIDDFGTGYSSLSYLSRFPVDELKIDRSFVKELPSDASAAAISTSVIDLAHRMDLRVIAEGVESADQLAFLAHHGCDEIQGYYCSHPVSAECLAALLQSGKRFVLPHRQLPGRPLLVIDHEVARPPAIDTRCSTA